MALDNFIPEVWSARLLANLHNALVYAQAGVINRDYEGEIAAAGDTVRINSIGSVTVGDYTKNTDMAAPQALSDAQATLTITQSKYFNFQIDDIDKAQQTPKLMNAAMAEAAFALANTTDQFIASQYTDISSGNFLTYSDGTNTSGDTDAKYIYVTSNPALQNTGGSTFTNNHAIVQPYDLLVDMAVIMDTSNTPNDGRWVVVPAFFEGLLLKDPRFVSFGQAAAQQLLQQGTGGPVNSTIGQVAGFTVMKSNQVPTVAGQGTPSATVYEVIAGHNMAWTFAEQISQTMAYRPEKRFADAVKGLHLYGAKVIRPKNMVLAKVVRNLAG